MNVSNLWRLWWKQNEDGYVSSNDLEDVVDLHCDVEDELGEILGSGFLKIKAVLRTRINGVWKEEHRYVLSDDGLDAMSNTLPPIYCECECDDSWNRGSFAVESVSDRGVVLVRIIQWHISDSGIRSIRDIWEMGAGSDRLIGDTVSNRVDLKRKVLFLSCWAGAAEELFPKFLTRNITSCGDVLDQLTKYKGRKIGDQVLSLKGTTTEKAITESIRKKLATKTNYRG